MHVIYYPSRVTRLQYGSGTALTYEDDEIAFSFRGILRLGYENGLTTVPRLPEVLPVRDHRTTTTTTTRTKRGEREIITHTKNDGVM